MRSGAVILAAAVAAAFAGQAVAAESSDATVVQGLVIQGRLPHEVQGLVITPSQVCLKPRKPPDPDVPPPKLVSSFPADGAEVKPGILVLRLTFDLPMACPGTLGADFPIANPCPAPLIDPVISKDRRTFLTICVVGAKLRYAIWLNRSRVNPLVERAAASTAIRWTSLAGHHVTDQEITFTTSGGEKVRTVHDAIAEDPFLLKMIGQSPADAVVRPVSAVAAQAPGADASSQPATTVSPVTVEAPVKASDLARSRGFIEDYAAPTARLDRYARWNARPCIVVSGLAAAQAASVKARLEDVARSAGLKPAEAGCKPNVEVEFSTEPQALVDQIVQKTPQVLGFQPGVDFNTRKTVTRPIQAWYMTASRGGSDTLDKASVMDVVPRPSLVAPDPGTTTSAQRTPATAAWANSARASQLPIQSTPESLDGPGRGSAAGCAPQVSTCQSVFWNVLVVVDVGKVQTQSVSSLTDYVAMLALSQPRSLDGCMTLASIIDLLAPTPCPGRDAPGGLTPADTAYLTALYASDPQAIRTMQKSAMSERMASVLVKAASAAAKSPGD